MSDLISKSSLKDRSSEYALSSDEFKRFCEIIDAEPDVNVVGYDIKKMEVVRKIILTGRRILLLCRRFL